MIKPTPLPSGTSPATQAVWSAWSNAEIFLDIELSDRCALAAALRAAADQKYELEIPFSMIDEWERITGSCVSFYAAADWGYKQALKDCKAIATELETLPDQ